jgi:hypothetical protein
MVKLKIAFTDLASSARTSATEQKNVQEPITYNGSIPPSLLNKPLEKRTRHCRDAC